MGGFDATMGRPEGKEGPKVRTKKGKSRLDFEVTRRRGRCAAAWQEETMAGGRDESVGGCCGGVAQDVGNEIRCLAKPQQFVWRRDSCLGSNHRRVTIRSVMSVCAVMMREAVPLLFCSIW